MRARLVLTLHLDAFGLATGGAYTVYRPDGERLACYAWPGFERDLLPEDAARYVCGEAVDWCTRQLTLF